jgi:hypothetical protein
MAKPYNLQLTIYTNNIDLLLQAIEGLPSELKEMSLSAGASDTVADGDIGDIDKGQGPFDEDTYGEQRTDASGERFDPSIHAWNKAEDEPSYAPSGNFRRRRGTLPKENEEGKSNLAETDYSPTLRALLSHVKTASDPVTLNRLEANPISKGLTEEELNVFTQSLKQRAEDLIGMADSE